MSEAIREVNLGRIPKLRSGKVREVFELGERLLIVATDRISAFDVVLNQGIPDKGKVLTQLSLFWFEKTADIVPNHLVTADVDEYPPELQPYKELLRGRSMLVRRAEVMPIECVVRGYLAGSGWKDYQRTGAVCGIRLPEGMQESEILPRPIFTPATKEESGHDINIDFEETIERVGTKPAEQLRETSIALYERARDYAAGRGIIIADTKFEFGAADGKFTLVDEVLTPDSSRFWPADCYEPGRSQPSYDKQYVRDYLETLDWDKAPPAPDLPEEVVRNTRAKYVEALRLLTGADLKS
jgi:phosphoribosylaminoimidazole-succinocarboxamide synthase